MALVRRSSIIGQLDHAISAGVNDASDMLTKQVSAAARGAAPTQSNGGSSNGGSEPTVNLSPAPNAAGAVPAWAANTEAAAVASKGASVLSVLGAFLIVAIGTGAAYALNRWVHKSTPFEIGNQISAYAAVVVFAGAVERLLEPFSNMLPGNGARAQYESVVAALANGHPTTTLKDVAAAKAKLDRALSNRTVLMWGLATGLAALVSGLGGFYLLHMIAATGWVSHIPTWIDALVTGLVVGTGTKPLHDLISKAQSAKESAAA
ncbi:hypothetical protein [Rugosimonospora africana]|uniref:Uncharacterized protein n=1 Tax=Rugosimonospora africana TaxID=556532 RepID=A0A8J3VPE0_9ACTN|nr:hypothetical protein [Rugosimonospora africana]GIH13872.1 hypothetical protein Raf01_20440 [Rugosimonospora africana]